MKTFVAPLLKRNGSSIKTPSGAPIFWLDRFLVQELQEAPNLKRPVVILLSGPPGAGKSLLGQQICYEVAYRHCYEFRSTDGVLNTTQKASSLIVTSETRPSVLTQNLGDLGYMQCPSAGNPAKSPDAEKVGIYTFSVLPPDELPASQKPAGGGRTPLMLIAEGPTRHENLPSLTSWGGRRQTRRHIKRIVTGIEGSWSSARANFHDVAEFPKILVIDSLNVLARHAERGVLFDCLLELFHSGPAFLILVLDTPGPDTGQDVSEHEYWEYMADISIRVDYAQLGEEKYFARRVEIVKTRFQEHTLGKQAAKIYDKPDFKPDPIDLSVDPEGPRPYLFRGGLFVFPSLHYVLSQVRYKKKLVKTQPGRPPLSWAGKATYQPAPPELANANTWVAWGPGNLAGLTGAATLASDPVNWDNEPPLNWPDPGCFELVGGGIPLNRTVATVGPRGGRTSYFAYRFLLDGVKNKEQTLLLSFMEPPEATRTTLRELAEAPQYTGLTITDDNPIIVYQRPGYVMPEEWFHRVLTTVGEHSPTRVALVAVDQWESGHPLLAKSRILLPTLIDFLDAHDVTSLIAAIDLDRTTLSRCGLTAKAAITLTFEHRRIPWTNLTQTRPSDGVGIDWYETGVPLAVVPASVPDERTKVVVRATRVGRGAPGFGRAVLEFMPEGPAAGSVMIPLSPEYPLGYRV